MVSVQVPWPPGGPGSPVCGVKFHGLPRLAGPAVRGPAMFVRSVSGMVRFTRAGRAAGSGRVSSLAWRDARCGRAQPWPIAMPSWSVTVTQSLLAGLRAAIAARSRHRAGSRGPNWWLSPGRFPRPSRVTSGMTRSVLGCAAVSWLGPAGWPPPGFPPPGPPLPGSLSPGSPLSPGSLSPGSAPSSGLGPFPGPPSSFGLLLFPGLPPSSGLGAFPGLSAPGSSSGEPPRVSGAAAPSAGSAGLPELARVRACAMRVCGGDAVEEVEVAHRAELVHLLAGEGPGLLVLARRGRRRWRARPGPRRWAGRSRPGRPRRTARATAGPGRTASPRPCGGARRLPGRLCWRPSRPAASPAGGSCPRAGRGSAPPREPRRCRTGA